jgi:hypothetical protein
MADQQLFVQNQPQTLAGSGATLGATTITLTEFTQIDGTLLTMADFGTKGFATIEPGNGTQEEQISFSGVTQNANGTATLTGVKTVLMVSPYTETSGTTVTHPGGSKLVVSNTAGFYNWMASKGNDETITGVYTFTNPNVPRMNTAHTYGAGEEEYFSTKRYSDSLTYAGAPDASTTTKGVVEIATLAEALDGASSGGTTAPLVVNCADNAYVRQVKTTKSFALGENVTTGQVLYLKSADSKWWIASAASVATSEAQLGIAYANGSTGEYKQVYLPGSNVSVLVGLTPGAYYLSDTPGAFSTTPGTYKKFLGYAGTAIDFLFSPVENIVSVAGTNAATTTANFNEAMTFFSTTDITGAEAEALSNGSVTGLHSHQQVEKDAFAYIQMTAERIGSMTTDTSGSYPGSLALDDLHVSWQGDAGGGGSGTKLYYTNTVIPLDTAKNFDLMLRVAVQSGHELSFGIGAATACGSMDRTDITNGAWFSIGSSIYACNGNASNNKNTDVTAGITITNFNDYRITRSGANLLFYINGTLVATHTTYLPTSNAARYLMEIVKGNDSNISYIIFSSLLFKCPV